MKQAIVIDSNANHRNTLIHQLSQIEFTSTFQFKSLTEAHNKLLSMTLFAGVLLISTEGNSTDLEEFLLYARLKHPNMSVIAVVDSVSLPGMRLLIGAGVDQLLIRPFNTAQLLQKIQGAESFRTQVLNDELKSSSRNSFSFTMEQITDRYLKAAFHGTLVENSVLPPIPEKNVQEGTLFLDCDHLRGINSIGIRSWMLWFKALEEQGTTHIEFDKLRPPLLQQASLVKGFIPNGSVVNSFYLFYWCEELDEEKEFPIVFGKHFGTQQMKLPKFVKEKRADKTVTFELDQSVVKFLRFYPGDIEIITLKET